MIGKQDSYLEKQEKSRHICQQCDLVEELSDEDLENVAGGALSNLVLSNIAMGLPPHAHVMYGIAPERLQPITGITAGIIAANLSAVTTQF